MSNSALFGWVVAVIVVVVIGWFLATSGDATVSEYPTIDTTETMPVNVGTTT